MLSIRDILLSLIIHRQIVDSVQRLESIESMFRLMDSKADIATFVQTNNPGIFTPPEKRFQRPDEGQSLVRLIPNISVFRWTGGGGALGNCYWIIFSLMQYHSSTGGGGFNWIVFSVIQCTAMSCNHCGTSV